MAAARVEHGPVEAAVQPMFVRGEALSLIALSLPAAAAAAIRAARITGQAAAAAVYRAITAKITTVDTPQVAVEHKMPVALLAVVVRQAAASTLLLLMALCRPLGRACRWRRQQGLCRCLAVPMAA